MGWRASASGERRFTASHARGKCVGWAKPEEETHAVHLPAEGAQIPGRFRAAHAAANGHDRHPCHLLTQKAEEMIAGRG